MSVCQPSGDCYYIVSISDHSVPNNIYEYEIPCATWVVFKSKGPMKEGVQTIFLRFYKEWLMFSGYEYAGLPDIEVYPIIEEKGKCGACEVWIAIKKKRTV